LIKMLIKFALVGLSGVGINMLVYTYLTTLSVNYMVAASCAFSIAASNNFVWNVLWTFKGRGKDKSIPKKYVSFFVIGFINLGVNLLILQFLVQYLQVGETLAQLIAITVVSGLNFLLNYLITFSEKCCKQKKGALVSYETNYYTNLQ